MDPVTIGLGLQALGMGAGLFSQYQGRKDAQKQQKQARKDWLLEMIMSGGRAGGPPQSQTPQMDLAGPMQGMGQLALNYANIKNRQTERQEDRTWRQEDRTWQRGRDQADEDMRREYQLWRMQQGGGRGGGGSGGASADWTTGYGP